MARDDGRGSFAEVKGGQVTSIMLDTAEDLPHALTTGDRAPPKGLYELCALAFGTTHEDAKERLLGTVYGKREENAT